MALLGTQRVLVTGATSGIGLAIATRLLSSGSKVTLVGRRFEGVKSILAAYPKTAFGVSCELRDRDKLDGLAKEAQERMGGMDGLVHGAGAIHHNSLVKTSDEELFDQIETNLLAPIHLTKAVLPIVEEGGAILFLSSTLGQRPISTSAIYSATKGGLDAFMGAVAVEGAPRGVRSNSIVLGMVDTPMITLKRPEETGSMKTVKEGFSELHLLNRLGNPRDVAEVGVSVLGTSWMTGARVVLDGGLLLRS